MSHRIDAKLVLTPCLLSLCLTAIGCTQPSAKTADSPVAASPIDAASADAQPAAAAGGAVAAAWPRVQCQSTLPEDRPLRAAFLLVDGVYNTELVAPFDILDHVRYQIEPGIDVFTVSKDGTSVTTAEGLVIAADYSFENAPPADILIVASAEHSRDSDLEDTAMITWVRESGQAARHVMSLCWGAFVLGQAELLDGHAATTFPRDFDVFAERFPTVDVRRGPTFVHDRRLITSQGGVRSYDAAMYLIDHLYGAEVARGVGGGLLIDWPYPEAALKPEVITRPSGP